MKNVALINVKYHEYSPYSFMIWFSSFIVKPILQHSIPHKYDKALYKWAAI